MLCLYILYIKVYTRTANHSPGYTVYTRTPSPGLVTVVTFIVKVYEPSWFQIKSHSCFTADPSNLFLQMMLTVRMPVETQNTVIQRNAYFAHPSVLLCAMLASDNDIPWRKAVSIIRKSRNDPPKPPRSKILMNMRIYIIPPLQWNANEWWEMVDWKSLKLHLPTILSTLSEED